jgi:hypothetical protein
MDCVGCDKCKLWGKLQVQALGMKSKRMCLFFHCLNCFRLGTALKILFSEHPIQLQRSEIVALINGFNRLSTSLYQLENTFKKCIKNEI